MNEVKIKDSGIWAIWFALIVIGLNLTVDMYSIHSDLSRIARTLEVTQDGFVRGYAQGIDKSHLEVVTSTRPDCERKGDDKFGIISCNFSPKGLYVTNTNTSDGNEMIITYKLYEPND